MRSLYEKRPPVPADETVSQLAIESLPSGVIVVGPEGLITVVNREIERQFGYAREELIGQSLDLLLPGALSTATPEARPVGAVRELVGQRKDGSRIAVEIGLSPLTRAGGVAVLASVMDISERQRLDHEHRRAIAEAIQFDQLVSEQSANFSNLPAHGVDQALHQSLGRIVEALDLDRGSVFRLNESGTDLVLTHRWDRPNLTTLPPNTSASDQFPWSLAKILAGEMACFSTVDDVPDERERESIRRYGTKSRVSFPISIEGKIVGCIGFSSTRTTRTWAPEILERLRLVALVFGSALARERADEALRASEQRFRTLADAAPALIWISGPDRMFTWFNRQWLAFVGRPMEQEVGYGRFDHVHPDDREACLAGYEDAIERRQPFTSEYRMRRQDGEWRWIIDKGEPSHGGDGRFNGYLGSCMDITDQKRAASELEQVRDRLQAENYYLRHEVQDRMGTGVIVGQSAAIQQVLRQIEQVAATDSTVLLLGETGTGKELFATRIHELSARHGRPMVRINCSAIPATLIESELFGREKGAFTGALARQIGRFELADHSTIFLDEIGDLPPDMQVKLLRVLEERQIERLGSPRAIHVDTRIITATHRDLEKRIAEGAFREDLFYRLNVFPIHVPPLRERRDDIPLLVWRFVDEFSKAFGKRIDAIPRENMAALEQYAWPGNIRELRNVVERAMIVVTGSKLTIPLPASTPAMGKRSSKLADVEREHIRRVLESTGWRVRGAGGAAERLGVKPTTLETRLAKLGLTRPKA